MGPTNQWQKEKRMGIWVHNYSPLVKLTCGTYLQSLWLLYTALNQRSNFILNRRSLTPSFCAYPVHVNLNTNSYRVHIDQTYLNLNRWFKSYWSKHGSLTVVPSCQDHLPPSTSVEEREESEIGQFKPLKDHFSSPNEGGGKGDEYETCNKVDGCLRRENWSPVPESPL